MFRNLKLGSTNAIIGTRLRYALAVRRPVVFVDRKRPGDNKLSEANGHVRIRTLCIYII